MADNKINVGGRLHSIATGNVLGGANEIFDDDKNKKQSEINTETYSLVNNVNERLNGLSPEQQSALNVATKATNNEIKLGYYVCGTEGDVAAKVISDATGYVLSKGGSIKVKMTNVNTATNATLNINSTGAKPLYYAGERATSNNSWEAGETVEVYYDGKNYYANNVAGGSSDGIFDISAKTGNTYETLSAALTAANSILSAGKKKGGMSIKFIQTTPAKYTVVKTEGATEQPIGTELQSDTGIISGTYTAGELSAFSTLPDTLNSSLTYYLAVTETVDEQEVTTYTTWVITYVQGSDNKYVQYRLMKDKWSISVANWQGVDDEPIAGSDNTVKSGGVFSFISPVAPKLKYNKTNVSGWTTYGYFKALAGYTYTFEAKLSESADNTKYFLLTESPTSDSGIPDCSFTITKGNTEGFKTFTNDIERTIYIRSYGALSGVEIKIENNTIFDIGKKSKSLEENINELQQDVTELQQDVHDLKLLYEPIPLNRLLGYSFTHLFNVTGGYGDAACYNGLIFQFVNRNEYVYVHNAADGTLVQTITMSNPNTKYHNNSVTFGNAKYDDGDTYPLLYASQENSEENKCIVYRVTGTIGNLTLEVVQTITYPANYKTRLYYHNCYIDTKNNYLILGGLVNSSWSATDNNTLQYMAFNLPALSDGDVTLDIANVLFKSAQFSNMPTTQGGFCKNGYLYQVFGVSAPQTFMVFDIKHCKFCYIFNFTDELMNAEPEGAFEYDNKVCVVFNGGAVYKLNT